jgi:hypothetical protein
VALATLTVRTAHLPDLSTDLDLESGGGESGASWIWALLRPSFQLSTPVGLYTRAPWGDPGESSWPVGAALLALAVGGLALLLFGLGRRSREYE